MTWRLTLLQGEVLSKQHEHWQLEGRRIYPPKSWS